MTIVIPIKKRIVTPNDVIPSTNPYRPYGALLQYWKDKENREVLIDGAAGTGKSRGIIEKFHGIAMKYDGARLCFVRKTRKSITQSIAVTYEKKVLPQGALGNYIKWRTYEQEYRYPNGSIIAVSGLDDPQKLLSSEWDGIFINEGIEIEQGDYEVATSRLRNAKVPYQQVVVDTNPSFPTHWLIRRAEEKKMKRYRSVHEDNPTVTPEYLSTLDALTGVRKLRLRYGLWVAAEGQVYEEFDESKHTVYAFIAPSSWKRIWGVDFGYTKPFVWQEWVIDHDGRMYLYKEIYKTQTLVEEHARLIKEITKDEPKPQAVVCDHDAEGRATLEKHLGISTIPADKKIKEGIQTVKERLKVQADGRPRLAIMLDSLYEIDETLKEKAEPLCCKDEFMSYVWDKKQEKLKEIPVDEYNHSMDTMRYVVMYLDGKGSSAGIFF